MKHGILLVVGLGLLSASCQKQTVEPRGNPLVDPRRPEVARANSAKVSLVRTGLDWIRQAAARTPESSRGRYLQVAAALERALKEGRVLEADIPRRAGEVVGVGPDPSRKWVRIHSRYLQGSPADPVFVVLVDTLFHEGIHLVQDLPAMPMVKGDRGVLVAWKLRRMALEWEAYRQDLQFKKTLFIPFLDTYRARLARQPLAAAQLPSFASVWAPLNDEDLRKINGAFFSELGEKEQQIKTFQQFLDSKGKPLEVSRVLRHYQKRLDLFARRMRAPRRKVDLVDLLMYLDGILSGSRYGYSRGKEILSFAIEPRSGKITASVGIGPVDSGIPVPLDLILLDDAAGQPYLVVAGTTHLDPGAGKGRLRSLPVEMDGSRWDFPPQRARDLAGAEKLATPSSLAVGAGGSLFVYDWKRRVLCPLLDTDGDGIPDRVGPAARLLGAPEGWLEHLAAARFEGANLVLSMRIVEEIAASPRLEFSRDGEGNWSFLRLQPG